MKTKLNICLKEFWYNKSVKLIISDEVFKTNHRCKDTNLRGKKRRSVSKVAHCIILSLPEGSTGIAILLLIYSVGQTGWCYVLIHSIMAMEDKRLDNHRYFRNANGDRQAILPNILSEMRQSLCVFFLVSVCLSKVAFIFFKQLLKTISWLWFEHFLHWVHHYVVFYARSRERAANHP